MPMWVSPSIIHPAVSTPSTTAGRAFFSRMSKKAAAREPVQAPVPEETAAPEQSAQQPEQEQQKEEN